MDEVAFSDWHVGFHSDIVFDCLVLNMDEYVTKMTTCVEQYVNGVNCNNVRMEQYVVMVPTIGVPTFVDWNTWFLKLRFQWILNC